METDMDQYLKLAKYYRPLIEDRDHFKNCYETVVHLFNHYSIEKGAKVLDAACGTGDIIEYLIKDGYTNIVGSDGSASMISEIKDFVKNKIKIANVSWQDLNTFFRDNGLFNAVFIMGHSLPHADEEDYLRIFSNIYDGLKEGGTFFFDMRYWIENENNQLVQPNRKENVFRDLGTITLNNNEYSAFDKVTYNKSHQFVTYKFKDLHEKSNDLVQEEALTVQYSIVSFEATIDKVIKAGFKKNKIRAYDFDNWSYKVIACTK
jgi:SAM-dependent methyltransferase